MPYELIQNALRDGTSSLLSVISYILNFHRSKLSPIFKVLLLKKKGIIRNPKYIFDLLKVNVV